MVGQFALGLAVSAPVIMFSNLQLRGVQATDVREEFLLSDYLGLRLITTLFSFVIIIGIILIAKYRSETAWVILAVGLAKCFEAISDIFYGFFQRRERMDFIAQSMVIKGLCSVGAMGLLVYMSGNVIFGAAGLAVIWALILIFYDVRISRVLLKDQPAWTNKMGSAKGSPSARLRPGWAGEKLRGLIGLSLPLGFVMMLISLSSNIPRYFIERYVGEYELGIFSAISYLMVAGGTIVNALGQAASPRLARLFAERKKEALLRFLGKLIGIGGLIGLVGILAANAFGREILAMLYGYEYAERADVLVILMWGGALGYISSVLGYGITAARYFRVQVPFFLIVTVSIMMASFWLIRGHGIYGAGLSIIIGMAVQVFGSLAINVYAIKSYFKQNNT